jgi:hypothetical protein
MDGWLQAGGTDGLAAICTNTVASNYQACYSCEVKAGALTAQAAQSTVDGSCFVFCGLRYFVDADDDIWQRTSMGAKRAGTPSTGSQYRRMGASVEAQPLGRRLLRRVRRLLRRVRHLLRRALPRPVRQRRATLYGHPRAFSAPRLRLCSSCLARSSEVFV